MDSWLTTNDREKQQHPGRNLSSVSLSTAQPGITKIFCTDFPSIPPCKGDSLGFPQICLVRPRKGCPRSLGSPRNTLVTQQRQWFDLVDSSLLPDVSRKRGAFIYKGQAIRQEKDTKLHHRKPEPRQHRRHNIKSPNVWSALSRQFGLPPSVTATFSTGSFWVSATTLVWFLLVSLFHLSVAGIVYKISRFVWTRCSYLSEMQTISWCRVFKKNPQVYTIIIRCAILKEQGGTDGQTDPCLLRSYMDRSKYIRTIQLHWAESLSKRQLAFTSS
jgi:hypothetical protein